ncbi:MAG: hypothetical protein F4X32_06395 [Candidatus Dadabacteria bacterium]|nr:hypothetical protein [Candidatus Dadabacteria bacterium]
MSRTDDSVAGFAVGTQSGLCHHINGSKKAVLTMNNNSNHLRITSFTISPLPYCVTSEDTFSILNLLSMKGLTL